jgi:hypothetical protein
MRIQRWPLKRIAEVSKKNTFGVFPNGIEISFDDGNKV